MTGRQPYAHAVRNRNHRRFRTSSTRQSASASTSVSTRTRLPSPRSISIRPVLFAADLAERGGSSTGALWCAAVGHGAAHWTGTKPGAAGSPSSFALASRRQTKIRLGAIPCLRATSDTFAPATDVSARILVLSSGDQWRLCFPFAKTSTRIDPLTSSLDQGHMLRQSRESNKGVLTKGTPFSTLLLRSF